MKTLILLSLLSLFFSPAFASTAIKLSCSSRKNVLISKFAWHLTTMKWGDEFQVAAGESQGRSANNQAYTLIHFQNGDDLVEYSSPHKYLFFYHDKTRPDICRFKGAYAYRVTELPVVNNNARHSQRRKY